MAEHKHISLVIGSMRTGGAERAFLNLANAFVKLGNSVDLVLVEKTGSFLPSLDYRIRIVDLQSKNARKGIQPFAKYLKEKNPDVLIAAQLHVQLMAILAIRNVDWKGKLLLNEQSTFSRNNTGFKKMLQYVLAILLFRRADLVTVVSAGAAKDFVEHFPFLKLKTSVVYNPIITDRSSRMAEERVNHPFFEEHVPVFVSAGRLVRSKNFEMLITAFQKARGSADLRLIILGDGPEKENLQQLINQYNLQKSVSLAGETENTFAYFARADLAVLSSDYEGLPAVLIEALFCGCPIISTNCPHGPEEILKDGLFGKLVPVGDADAMAEAMIVGGSGENIGDRKNRANDFHSDTIAFDYLRLIDSEQK